MLPALPFAIIAAIGVSQIVIGPGSGLLPLLAVGPAVATAVAGLLSTLAAGAAALAVCVLFAAGMQPGATAGMAEVRFLAVAGVTAASVLASRARGRRDRQLAQARLVTEATQQALLRPVPRQAGPVKLASRYLSASSGARVGGDLYEVATTPDGVRLIVGDAKGKGLPAVQSAAAVLGVFREAAHEEDSLAAIVSRIETSLARQLSDEQFVTAILAEVSPDGTKIELLSCGHPAPLLLGANRPGFAGSEEGSLPLGLGHLADVPRIPVTIAFEPGDALLFYTDGTAEARNKAGAFFPLADCAAVRAPPDPATLPGRLSDEVIRYAGHAPDDDVALLVIYRDGGLTVRRRRRDSRQRPDSGPGPAAALTTMLDQVIAWSQALAPLRAPAAAL
jgi:serine phosphatase RsbU (regulator of sigma subunit)